MVNEKSNISNVNTNTNSNVNTNTNSNANTNNIAPTINFNKEVEASSDDSLVSLADNLIDWDLGNFYSPVVGTYCLQDTKKFDHEMIWYKKPIKLSSVQIHLSFISSIQPNFKGDPLLVNSAIALGRQEKISEFYFSALGDEVVHLRKFDSKLQKLIPDYGAQIPLPIRLGTEVDVNISPIINSSNVLNLLYRIEYTRDPLPMEKANNDYTYKTIAEDFPQTLRLPTTKGNTFNTQIGIGIFRGGCISSVKYWIDE